MRTFTRHLFSTLTYSRTQSLQDTWKATSKDFNRFHQRFKRLHNQTIGYLRVIEAHSDGYPHIHAIMQFPSACIAVDNSVYFDRTLYAQWKSLWPRGHSDYQKPRRSGLGTLSYLMKYLIKNTTSKTIWSKVLMDSKSQVPQSYGSKPFTPLLSSNGIIILPTHSHGVKLATWSRNFDFQPLSLKPSN